MTDEVIGPQIEEKSDTTDEPATVGNTENILLMLSFPQLCYRNREHDR